MAQRTTADERMLRSELAAYLTSIAREFDHGDAVAIEVGNKSVELDPPDTVDVDVEVAERSSVLRGTRESITIEVHWKR